MKQGWTKERKQLLSAAMKRHWQGDPRKRKLPECASGGGVYAVRERGTNFVKIGCTTNFRGRFGTMQIKDNPRELIFLGWLSRRTQDEKLFHEVFSEFKTSQGGGSEWFELPDAQIVKLMAMMKVAAPAGD